MRGEKNQVNLETKAALEKRRKIPQPGLSEVIARE